MPPGFWSLGSGLKVTPPPPAPTSTRWPRACSGRKPLTLPGPSAKRPTDEVSERGGERELTRAPRGSPPASALPSHAGRGPGLFLAAAVAAVLLLPPGMCDSPECSRDISHVGAGSRQFGSVFCLKLYKVPLNNDFAWSLWAEPTQMPSWCPESAASPSAQTAGVGVRRLPP